MVGGEYRQQGKAKLKGTLIEKERLHQKARVWRGNVSKKEHTILFFFERKKNIQSRQGIFIEKNEKKIYKG